MQDDVTRKDITEIKRRKAPPHSLSTRSTTRRISQNIKITQGFISPFETGNPFEGYQFLMEDPEPVVNPLEPSETLRPSSHLANGDLPQTTEQPPLPEDSAVTKAEKVEWREEGSTSPGLKRKRVDELNTAPEHDQQSPLSRKKGVAPIRPEYLLNKDAGENVKGEDPRANGDQRSKKQKGQNTSRSFGSSKDAIQLCVSRATEPEFAPKECQYGENCKYEHDIRRYLSQGKREDLKTFEKCPVWEARGRCEMGWRCRFAMSHAEERETSDGKKELILTKDAEKGQETTTENETVGDVVNVIKPQQRIDLGKRKFQTPKADEFTNFLNNITQHESKGAEKDKADKIDNSGEAGETKQIKMDTRAQYVEPPTRPSEKRRLYFGAETPVLAPLTTQGNLPFRRLCTNLGAQVTWSEMAMSLPLLQGQKSEWALMKAHKSEVESPKFHPTKKATVLEGYDNGRDLKFGTQIAANKPWLALRATEIVTTLCPHLRAVDLNCGCPIDLVYRQGAGSALMDQPAKLEKILRGMNAVSGEVPVQVKIRMGTKDNKPTAEKLVERLAFGGPEAVQMGLGPSGIAAVTLHGRSRQQRYTKMADWSYIAQCASLINNYNNKQNSLADTVQEPEPRDTNPSQRLYFVGNGDCYSHIDYFDHIDKAKVDSVMIARGALIKPWIFEEISAGQYLDKSSSERLRYIEQFTRYGLETWGSDEMGVGTTRRFLLEWLSFACRYVPIGLLEHLPPVLNDRPPAYKGRDDLETLMASDNVKDWIKISEMFLGPAHPNFKFDPKHKSNSYDTGGDYDAEG